MACDTHPIRLLSVVRHMSRTEQQYICLSVSFSAYDGSLAVSTEEEAFTSLGKSDKSNLCVLLFIRCFLASFIKSFMTVCDHLCYRDSLIVSLHVCLIDIMEPEICSPSNLPTSLKFRCSSMLTPGQWHHLAVVMAKDVKKSCVASVYFNGKAFGTGKV